MLLRGKKLQWQVRIGIEIHAQLKVKTKLFANSPVIAKVGNPNSAVSFFDAAYPGCLPSLNEQSVHQAVRAAIALKCEINEISTFERKHYFYQDLPLGYQITQQSVPFAHSGKLSFGYWTDNLDVPDGPKIFHRRDVGIERIQIEQDSGKSIHDQHPDLSLIDLNRAGVGLIEIVFKPDIRDPIEAAAALKTTQEILRQIGVCDGNLETGSMRCDVNVSVSPEGSEDVLASKRVEIKNLNSFQRVRDAATFEAKRQIAVIENGKSIDQETRGYDPVKGETFKIRDKEGHTDYRFMPDPDIPSLLIPAALVSSLKLSLPELPSDTLTRLVQVYHLNESQVEMLIGKQAVNYFENTMKQFSREADGAKKRSDMESVDASLVFNWISGELLGNLNELNLSFQTSPISPSQLAKLLTMMTQGKISALQAKRLLTVMFSDASLAAQDPEIVALSLGIALMTDKGRIEDWCKHSIEDPENVGQLQKLLEGNKRMVQYFVGDVMKRSKGKADPKLVGATISKLTSSG